MVQAAALVPDRSCIVCSTQRSGTTLLCWALSDTGVLGRPEEYFLDGDPSSFPPGWTFWEDGPLAREHDVRTRREYLDLVYRLGTTPKGVFAAKLMWNNLPWVTKRLNALPEFEGMTTAELLPMVFPDLRPVHLTRKDRARQAISWAKAAQDGVWFASDDMPAQPAAEAVYDFDFIHGLQGLIVEGERGWRRLFTEIGVTPCELVYEDLASPDGHESAIRSVAEHLDVDPANLRLPTPRTHRLSNDVNEDWLRRYDADLTARAKPAE